MSGKLIITIDDYGFSKSVNQSVHILGKLGVVSATNIMPNMPFVQDVNELSKQVPKLSLGVHINLTQGKPLLPPAQIPSIVSPDGNFYPLNTQIKRSLTGKINKLDCLREIDAQVGLLKALLGDRLNHWNTHQGIHRIEPFFGAACKICHEYSIPAMRNPLHSFLLNNKALVVQFVKLTNFYNYKFQRIFNESYYCWLKKRLKRYFSLPDGTLAKEGFNTIELLDLLSKKQLPDGVWEIACHTATSTVGLWGTSQLEQRVEEYQTLKNSMHKAIMDTGVVKLVGFEKL